MPLDLKLLAVAGIKKENAIVDPSLFHARHRVAIGAISIFAAQNANRAIGIQ
jgi:hypothetical protein